MSDHYIALTRKYRPRTFDDIVSQEHVSNTLKNAIEHNRISHAYMFCGPRGVGKTTMARVLARTINEIDADVDGEALGNTLNIIEIDAASNNKVDDIHRIRETVRIPPQNGRYKIYIIDEVHMLSKQAYNALLKTLEEPPAHVIFIFATTEPQKVLPTIMSRCQRYDFRRIKVNEIVDRLKYICEKEHITIDNESLHVIAHKADGALRDAQGLLDQAIAFCGADIKHEELLQALNVVSSDRLFELTRAILDRDTTAGIQLINNLLQKGYDIQEFITSLTEHFRNLYLARDRKNMELIETSGDTRQRYADMAQKFSEDDIMRMLHLVNEGQFRIREASQPRIQLEIVILKLITMTRIDGLRDLLSELHKFQGSGSSDTTEEYSTASKPGPKPKVSGGRTDDDRPKTESQQRTKKPAQNGGTMGPGSTALHRPENQNRNSSFANFHRGAITGDQTEPDNDEVGHISGNLALVPQDESANTGTDSLEESSEIESGNLREEPEHQKPLLMHELTGQWVDFVTHLEREASVSRAVVLAFGRLQPVDLNHGEILLPCYEPFTLRVLEEHNRELNRELRRYFRRPLNMRFELRESNNKQEINDPYIRFKQLQEKDPAIRLIVDLFGAEIEY